MDKPEGKTESAAEGWRPGSWDPEGRAERNASPGVVLHDCVLGKAEEGGTEVHAHGRVPAVTVILERAEEEAETSEGRSGRGDTLRPWTRGLGVGVQVPPPYPDVFKHLHGGKGLEGTDETLRVAEASDNIGDSQEE